MHTTNLRKVGGSVMLVIPPVLLNLLHLKADAAVAVGVEDGRLIVDPKPRPRYTLEELLAKCDPAVDATEMSEEDRIWINLPPVGREL
jgi:antitoxin ChpS